MFVSFHQQVTFPEEATKEDKALILGAAFLADYVFFEKVRRVGGSAFHTGGSGRGLQTRVVASASAAAFHGSREAMLPLKNETGVLR